MGVMIKTSTEAAVFNQAAFTLLRDITGLTMDSDHIDYHSRNWKINFVIRFVYVTAAACIASFIPIFSDLASITAAISITPTTFLLPVIMWNKKHGSTAPKWRLYVHYVCLFLSVVTALTALIGAVSEITINFEDGEV